MIARSIRDLGLLTIVLAFVMLLPIPVAVALTEYNQAWVFLTSGVLLLFVGYSMHLSFRGVHDDLIRQNWFLIPVWIWVVLPLFATIPSYLINPTEGLFIAYFEMVAGFTTTGATLAREWEAIPQTLLFWRSLIEWTGGFAAVLFAIGIMSNLGVGGMRLFRAGLPRGEGIEIIDQLKGLSVTLFPIYLMCTVACCFLLWISGEAFFDALVISLTTMGSGGFTLHDEGVVLINNAYGEGILAIFMLVSATNLVLFSVLFSRKGKAIEFDREPKYLLILLVIGTAALVFQATEGFSFYLEDMLHAVYQVASAISTTGFALENHPNIGTFPTLIIALLAVIGGMAGSSTGGIKIMRIVILFRHAGLELRRLAHRHDATPLIYSKTKALPSDTLGIWLVFISFFIILALGILFFAFDEHGFESSLFLSLAAVTNAGPLPFVLDPTFAGYDTLSTHSGVVYLVLMVLGRLEGIFAFALISKYFWIR